MSTRRALWLQLAFELRLGTTVCGASKLIIDELIKAELVHRRKYRAVPRAGSPSLGTPDDPQPSWVQGNVALFLGGLLLGACSEQNQASLLLRGNIAMPEMMLILRGRSVQGG